MKPPISLKEHLDAKKKKEQEAPKEPPDFSKMLEDQKKQLPPGAVKYADFWVQQSDYGKGVTIWNALVMLAEANEKINYLKAELDKLQKK